jgi:sec-independent protein translocase protein TatA
MLGAPELIVVLLIVLVLFGGAKLPKLAKSLGEAQREFRKGTDDDVPTTASNTVTPTPPVVAAPPTVAPPAVAPPAVQGETPPAT